MVAAAPGVATEHRPLFASAGQGAHCGRQLRCVHKGGVPGRDRILRPLRAVCAALRVGAGACNACPISHDPSSQTARPAERQDAEGISRARLVRERRSHLPRLPPHRLLQQRRHCPRAWWRGGGALICPRNPAAGGFEAAVEPGHRHCVSGPHPSRPQVWDARTTECVGKFAPTGEGVGSEDALVALASLPRDPGHFAALSKAGKVYLLTYAAEPVREFAAGKAGTSDEWVACTASARGKYLYCFGASRQATALELASGTVAAAWKVRCAALPWRSKGGEGGGEAPECPLPGPADARQGRAPGPGPPPAPEHGGVVHELGQAARVGAVVGPSWDVSM